MENKLEQMLEIGKLIELTRDNVLVWQPEINNHILGETSAGNVGVVIAKSPNVSYEIHESDIVFYGKMAGAFLKFNKEKFVIIGEKEILGKVSIIDDIVCSPIPFSDDFEIGETGDLQKYFDELAVANGMLLTGNNLNLQIN